MHQIIVDKGRTSTLEVKLPYDVSGDEITSQIRVGRNPRTALIAEWQVSYKTDGSDGALLLVLDDSVTSQILETIGYMDMKRFSGGEPISVFDNPITVLFKDVVTE